MATRPCPTCHDRALVYLLSHGLLEMNDEVQAAMSSTETDFSDRNFWTARCFETGDPRNQWLSVLPTYHPPQEIGVSSTYPLALLSPKPHSFLNSQYGNMDRQLDQQGHQSARLNPDDAMARGIGDGDWVRVFNERAELTTTARLTTDVAAGVVLMPMGHWPSLSEKNLSVNALNSTRYADIGRAPTFSDTAVEVEVVSEH